MRGWRSGGEVMRWLGGAWYLQADACCTDTKHVSDGATVWNRDMGTGVYL